MTWIAFFSQTGSEIVRLTKVLNKKPDLIVTNNFDTDTHHPELRMGVTIMSSSHDNLMNYFRKQVVYEASTCLITLHGYLRIIPADICSKYEIYNGHPAPIHLYPELKGKDKQEDLYKYKDRYERIGCIIHKVTPDLDEGDIIISLDEINTLTSLEDSYLKIKPLSLKSWEIFFNDHLPNKMFNRQ